MNVQQNINKTISQAVKSSYPNAKVILYGSRARGDAHEHSDWDVIVVVDEERITPALFLAVGNPLYDIAEEKGIEINPIIYTKKQWNTSHPTMFRHNIHNEGIEI